jgi:hypothetical protein
MGERRSGDGGVWVYRIERDETRREFVVAKVVFEDDRVKSVITSREPYPIEYQIPP